LPGVFSTPQWGGRAYKLPGPGSRGMKRPLLLSHVCVTRDGHAVSIDFKLPKKRADAVIRKHDWIERHSFRTLAPSGWVSATVRTKAQVKAITALLCESREQYPIEDAESRAKGSDRANDDSSDPVLRRMDRVLGERNGWNPGDDDRFEKPRAPKRTSRRISR